MKILFAVDGSGAAGQAVRQVARNLDAKRDEIAFYFAPPEVNIRHAHDADAMRERARRAIADAVFGDVKSLLPPELVPKATMICADHTPTEGILIEADRWNADLIVVGARGLTQVDKWVLGSVADGVAQRSKRPVFVSRPRIEGRDDQPLRLLYAYDGSASCTAALGLVEKFSLPETTEVIAFTVVESRTVANVPQWVLDRARSADTEAMAQVWDQSCDEDKRQAHDELAAFMARQPAPFNKAETLVGEGHAAEEILRVVKERQIDCVVLGSRGRGVLQRLFIGSTSDRVLHQSPCSVLIVREA